MQISSWLEKKAFTFLPRVPLMAWVVAAAAGILIPLAILSAGYIPMDDVMMYVAKVLSGKPWPEILVMDERFARDEHPGWLAILGAAHQWLHLDADALVGFSIAVPFIALWLVLLAGSKRPEAVLLAMLAGTVLATSAFSRLLLGRPLVLMVVVYVALLQLWTRREKIPPWVLVVTVLLIGFSVWVHGGWYFFGFVIAGFVLANEWRKAFLLGYCWLGGAVLGATFSGHPYGQLHQTFVHLLNCFSGYQSERMLVYELRPQYSDLFFIVILLALVWRVARGEWQGKKVWTSVLALAVLGWILGFKIVRFWTDWGFPAALLWLIQELDDVLEAKWAAPSWKALGLTGLAAAAVYFSETSDVNSRWSSNLTAQYVTPETPGIAGWLPDKGGIIYSPDMTLFNSMFYKNPTADWRYVLGFEPGIMTPENYAIYRKIQWKGAVEAFELWVAKMRPEDRMILQQDSQPPIPGLEWHYATDSTWIGRLPRTNAIPAIKQ